MTLKKIIQDRLLQLQNRMMMIPRYVERPEKFVGKKDFSLDDLPKIQEEIRECKAALWGMENYESHKPKSNA